jgi:hypothetical protein
MRTKLSKIAQAATLGFAITLTFSCPRGDPDDDNNGGGGRIIKLGIKDIGESSFTAIDKWYDCRENGTLEEETDDYPTSYTINGSTLSFGEAEFSGNSASLIGSWNTSSLQHIKFHSNNSGYGLGSVSKAVFTQNSLSVTLCVGEIGEKERDGVAIIEKVIDCGTVEYTKGTETVRLKVSGTEATATYKGKTCKLREEHSESQMKAACTQAYNKAKDEGYDGGGHAVEDYYYEILYKEVRNCQKSLPEWMFD